MLVRIIPENIGEHDVDTIIHTLFARIASNGTFEGLCNPPGGDWSGVSLLTENLEKELRWVSLPRVSNTLVDGAKGKRPDHVLQIFGMDKIPVILALESKELAKAVENNIGSRLIAYMKDLLRYKANAERDNKHNAEWRQSNTLLDISGFKFASGVAFIIHRDSDISNVEIKANADIILGLCFKNNATICEIQIIPCTDVGTEIADFLSNVPEGHNGIYVSRQSEI